MCDHPEDQPLEEDHSGRVLDETIKEVRNVVSKIISKYKSLRQRKDYYLEKGVVEDFYGIQSGWERAGKSALKCLVPVVGPLWAAKDEISYQTADHPDPDALRDALRSVWDDFQNKHGGDENQGAESVVGKMNEALAVPGVGGDLGDAVGSWKNSINRITTVRDIIDPCALDPGEGWTGDAADRYKSKLPAQYQSVVNARSCAITLQQYLQWTIDVLIDYWSTILDHFGFYLGSLVLADQYMANGDPRDIVNGTSQITYSRDMMVTALSRFEFETDALEQAMEEACDLLKDLIETSLSDTWPQFASTGALVVSAPDATPLPTTTGATSENGPGTRDYDYYLNQAENYYARN
jgi:uncharacterized protein YukE